MTNLEKACAEYNQKWVDSFDDRILSDYKFTKRHKAAMNKIFDKAAGKPKRRLSKRAIAVLIAAAIILSITVTAFAVPTTRKFILEKFSDHSEYTVPHDDVEIIDKEPSLGFIPKGFTPTETTSDELSYSCKYENQDGKYFYIDKDTIDTFYAFDTEQYDEKIIEYESVDYILYHTEYTYGVIWNDGKYMYGVVGNLSESEILNIAICTK